MRFDFFRLLAVHRYGGFYLDIDVRLARRAPAYNSYVTHAKSILEYFRAHPSTRPRALKNTCSHRLTSTHTHAQSQPSSDWSQVELHASLDPLRVSGCVVVWEGAAAGNYFLGASPGHPFIALVIEMLVAAVKSHASATTTTTNTTGEAVDLIMASTGPQLMDRALSKFNQSTIHVLRPSNEAFYQVGDFGRHTMAGVIDDCICVCAWMIVETADFMRC